MDETKNKVLGLLAQFSGQGNTLTIPVPYVKLTGSIEGGLLLNQIVYWSDRTKMLDGWFAKSYDEWEQELFLTKRVVTRLTGLLRKVGVETKVKRFNGSPTLHWRIDLERFEKALHSCTFQSDKMSLSKSDKMSLSSTMSTHKTTTSNTSAGAKTSPPSTKLLKYPSDVYKYQVKHIEQYQQTHGDMLDVLLTSWGMDLYKHITEMPLYDARQFIIAHQDLERLHIPTDEYAEVIKTTRTKFAWRYSKGGAVQPSDIGGALTDYLQAKQAPKPSTPSTSQAQADAKAAHDYYQIFGKEMPHAK